MNEDLKKYIPDIFVVIVMELLNGPVEFADVAMLLRLAT